MRQCRLALWVVIVWRLVEVHEVKLGGKRRHEYTYLCFFLFYRSNTLNFNQVTVKPPLPVITSTLSRCFYAFVRRTLAKQLYTKSQNITSAPQHVLIQPQFQLLKHLLGIKFRHYREYFYYIEILPEFFSASYEIIAPSMSPCTIFNTAKLITLFLLAILETTLRKRPVFVKACRS